MQFRRRPVPQKIYQLDFKNDDQAELVTWWYCELIKNHRAGNQPKVLVCFRQVEGGNKLGDFRYHRIPVDELGQFRIGTIWKGRICREEVVWDTALFHVDFDPTYWQYYSPKNGKDSNQPALIPQTLYPLPDNQHHDPSWLLQFRFSNEPVGLLLPCMEFFSRCYGRSQHVVRVLATYPWKEAEDKLFVPLVEPAPPGVWAVNLQKRTVNGDTVLLAHIKYDAYAKTQAISIWSQLEAAQGASGGVATFIKVGPWFQGPARLKVKGLWIENGKRFLGLQVVGCSDPGGVPIYRDRENTNKTGPIEEGIELGNAWNGIPAREIIKYPEIVDVTGDENPDSDQGSVEVEDADFEILGIPRKVIDTRRSTTKGKNANSGSHTDASRFSGDEVQGKGKGVGHASFHAPVIMESQGVLRDVWNMLKQLESLHPTIVRKVEFLTVDGNFLADAEPTLIGFKPFTQEELESEDIKEPNWPFLDTKTGDARGALFARIDTPKGHIHFFEIQRRPRTIKKGDGEGRVGEQPFRGIVFALSHPSRLDDWVKYLLDRARYTSGVLTKIVGACPGTAIAFVHKPAAAEKYPQERAIVRALSLMNVELPREQKIEPGEDNRE